MKKFGLALLALVYSGCTTVNYIKQYPDADLSIPRTLLPYVKSFELEARKQGAYPDLTELTMRVVKMEEGTLGECSPDELGHPHIDINAEAWNASTVAFRESLVFHELGHCVLGRPHCKLTNKQGVATSVMYPIMRDRDMVDWTTYRKHYVRELFHPFPACPKEFP